MNLHREYYDYNLTHMGHIQTPQEHLCKPKYANFTTQQFTWIGPLKVDSTNEWSA